MKIKRIHTISALMSIEHKFSFDVSQHSLEYLKELNLFKIDNTLVPISNVREVLIEQESQTVSPQRVSTGGVEATSADSSSELTQAKTTVKKTSKVK